MDIVLLRRSIRNSAEISFSRSGGPGGQNVNKLNTKATLRLRLSLAEGLSEAERIRLWETLGSRLVKLDWEDKPDMPRHDAELVISSSEERYQRVNLERAYARVEALIVSAARLPRKRKPTKPSAAAREKRLKLKHLRGEKKAARRFSGGD